MKLAVALALLALGGCSKKEEPAKSDPPPAAPDAAAAAKTPPPPDAAPAKPAETFELGNVMPDAWFAADGGCAKVLARIAACAKDKAFLDALLVDTDDEDRKLQLQTASRAEGWEAKAANVCSQLVSVTYEEEGFLGARWDDLAAPDVLADCAKLGTAINDAGGLFGGSSDS